MNLGKRISPPLSSNEESLERYERLISQAKTEEDRAYFTKVRDEVLAIMKRVRNAPVR